MPPCRHASLVPGCGFAHTIYPCTKESAGFTAAEEPQPICTIFPPAEVAAGYHSPALEAPNRP